MDKQEIIDAIEKGIAGQGTMVDLGGILPKVLKAIVDALPEGGSSPIAPEPIISINDVGTREDMTKSQAAEYLGVTEDELDQIRNQLVIDMGGRVLTRAYLLQKQVVFGYNGISTDIDSAEMFELRVVDDTIYHIYRGEA